MKKNEPLKRFLALLLCAAMIVTYMPSTAYALVTGNGSGETTVDEESPKTANDSSENAEAADKEDKAKETKNSISAQETAAGTEKSGSESQDGDETAAEPSKEEEPAGDTGADNYDENAPPAGKEDATEPAEDAKPADEQTEEPADVEEPTDEKEPEPGVEYPEQSFYEKVGGVQVYVDAPKAALPEGTTAKIEAVKASEVEDAVKAEMGKDVEVIKAVDITFYDKDGKEIEPLKRVSVKFVSKAFKKVEDAEVVHIDDNGEATKVADRFVDAEGKNVEFEVKDFSVYVVVDAGVNARLLVKFMNGETEIASMYVKEHDR